MRYSVFAWSRNSLERQPRLTLGPCCNTDRQTENSLRSLTSCSRREHAFYSVLAESSWLVSDSNVTLDPSAMCEVRQSRKNSGEKEKKGNEASKESKGKTHLHERSVTSCIVNSNHQTTITLAWYLVGACSGAGAGQPTASAVRNTNSCKRWAPENAQRKNSW
jgi:hypothetical protein